MSTASLLHPWRHMPSRDNLLFLWTMYKIPHSSPPSLSSSTRFLTLLFLFPFLSVHQQIFLRKGALPPSFFFFFVLSTPPNCPVDLPSLCLCVSSTMHDARIGWEALSSEARTRGSLSCPDSDNDKRTLRPDNYTVSCLWRAEATWEHMWSWHHIRKLLILLDKTSNKQMISFLSAEWKACSSQITVCNICLLLCFKF